MLFMYYYSVIWALYANGYIAVAYWHSSFIWNIVVFNAIWCILEKWTDKMTKTLDKDTNTEQFILLNSIDHANGEVLSGFQILSFLLYIDMLLIKYYYEYPAWDCFILPVLEWAVLCWAFYKLIDLEYNMVGLAFSFKRWLNDSLYM